MIQAPVAREPTAGETRPATAEPNPVTWQAAPRLRRLATIAVVVIVAAVLTRHASLLLAGAPALAALAAARRGTRPEALDATVTVAPSRCFEGEDVEVIATLATPMDEVTFRIEPGPAVELSEDPATQVVVAGQPARAQGQAGLANPVGALDRHRADHVAPPGVRAEHPPGPGWLPRHHDLGRRVFAQFHRRAEFDPERHLVHGRDQGRDDLDLLALEAARRRRGDGRVEGLGPGAAPGGREGGEGGHTGQQQVSVAGQNHRDDDGYRDRGQPP